MQVTRMITIILIAESVAAAMELTPPTPPPPTTTTMMAIKQTLTRPPLSTPLEFPILHLYQHIVEEEEEE